MNGRAFPRLISRVGPILALPVLLPVGMALATDDVAGHFVTLNQNGGWCWFQDPRAIIDSGQLLVGTLAGTTSSFANAGDVQVSTYNFTSGNTAISTLSGSFQSDDHNVPALMTLPDGRYMAIYQKHGSDNLVRWRITTNPASTSAWNAEQTGDANPVNDGFGNTYANPFYLSVPNKIISFSRSVGYDTNYSVFSGVNASNDSSLTYNYGGHFLVWNNPNNGVNGANGGGGRPYVKYASNGVDTVWFTNTEDSPDNYWNSIYGGYITFNAAGAGTVYKSDGTLVGPLSTTSGTTQSYSPQTFTKIFDGTTNNGNNAGSWTNSMQLDSAGHPYAAFSIRVNDPSDAYQANDMRYYYTHFDGAAWQTHFMAYAGSPMFVGQSNYAGLAALDPTNPNVVFVSTNYTPDTDQPLAHYEIYQGTTSDGGATWTWTAITSNSTADNIRPFVPAWSGAGTRPLLWLRGTYGSYTSYDLSLVGTLAVPTSQNYWNNAGGGNWDVAGNWTVGVPNAAAAAAFFGNGSTATTSNSAITINGTKTIGALTFDGSAYNYSLINGTNGALSLNNGSGVAAVITVSRGSHSIGVPVSLTSSGVNLSVGTSASLTISGNITGTGGITKTGAGTAILSGSSGTVGGNTSVTGGVLVADGAALPPGNLSINGANFGSTVTRAIGTGSGQIQIIGGASGFAATNGLSTTVTITNGGSAISWGGTTFNPSQLVLTGTASTGVTLNADINLNIAGAARSIQSNGGVNTLGGVISGATSSISVTSGTGILALSNSGNSYGGGTTIGVTGVGVVRATATHALGTGAIGIGTSGNASTGRLELQSASAIMLANAVNLFGRTNDSVAIESISGTNTLGGQISMGVGGTRYWIQSDAGALTLAGGITSNAGNPSGGGGRSATLRGSGNGNVSGTIQNGTTTNGIAIVKTDTGTWTLSGANTYTGGTTVSAGTLIASQTGSIPIGSSLSINDNGSVGSTAIIAANAHPGHNGGGDKANHILRIASLAIGSNSLLDLKNNDMIWDYTGSSGTGATFQSALTYIVKGLTNPASAGGIKADGTDTLGHSTVPMPFDNGATSFQLSSWESQSTTTHNQVIAKYTYFGDANLDGQVNGSDYLLVDSGQGAANIDGHEGDTNLDGTTSGADYLPVDSAQNNGVGDSLMEVALRPSAASAATAAAVPEPAGLALLGAIGGALMSRRRQRLAGQ